MSMCRINVYLSLYIFQLCPPQHAVRAGGEWWGRGASGVPQGADPGGVCRLHHRRPAAYPTGKRHLHGTADNGWVCSRQGSFCVSTSQWKTTLHYRAGIILFMRPANEKRCFNVTSSLTGWTHTQNDPWPGNAGISYTEMKMLFRRNFHQWFHMKLSFWQLPVQQMKKNNFTFSCIGLWYWNENGVFFREKFQEWLNRNFSE